MFKGNSDRNIYFASRMDILWISWLISQLYLIGKQDKWSYYQNSCVKKIQLLNFYITFHWCSIKYFTTSSCFVAFKQPIWFAPRNSGLSQYVAVQSWVPTASSQLHGDNSIFACCCPLFNLGNHCISLQQVDMRCDNKKTTVILRFLNPPTRKTHVALSKYKS